MLFFAIFVLFGHKKFQNMHALYIKISGTDKLGMVFFQIDLVFLIEVSFFFIEIWSMSRDNNFLNFFLNIIQV